MTTLSTLAAGVSNYWFRNRAFILSALALTTLYNFCFYTLLFATYPPLKQPVFVLGLSITLGALTLLLLHLFAWGRAARWVLAVIFLAAALSAYFMDSFKVVINRAMLQNALQTDVQEANDLLTLKLAFYLLLLFVVPAYLLWQDRALKVPATWSILLRDKAISMASCVVLILSMILMSGGSFHSFFREQKTVRYFNPISPLTSAVFLARGSRSIDPASAMPFGVDARIPADDKYRDLLIIVVGETARADHFSLNGYTRQTNPLLAREKVINFPHVSSCGTSTNVSVPCMFSSLGRRSFEQSRFEGQENLLDVLAHAQAKVLWRDNNSSSKGVAARERHVEYQDFKNPKNNPVCDSECRDIGMLTDLQSWIDAHKTGDLVVVLHQMGSHGPAYFKRYPKAFERFTPACQNVQLERCSTQEIINAYDNTILYTDYFLSQTIALLKKNAGQFEAGMLYMSDHGESLGENGLYLHAMPYALAPEAQTHVPAIFWHSENVPEIDPIALQARADHAYSHDNLFHTALGFLEIRSKVYRPDLDILRN